MLAEFDGAYLDEVTDRMNERDVLDWWRGRELESESIGIAAGGTGLAAFGLLTPRDEGVVELQAGLGEALLLHGFGELYRRGERRIGLGVDASNPTGATRLYERVGMFVAWQADTYEKAL